MGSTATDRGRPRWWLVVVTAAAVAAAACGRARAGERCAATGRLTCTSPERALACVPGEAGAPSTWAEVACRGPRGCVGAGEGTSCDDTTAAEGDGCRSRPEVAYACAVDRASALECRGGQFALWRRCRGAAACTVESGRNVRCDTTLSEPGDPCGQAGSYACTPDGATMLACDGQRFAPASSCGGPARCRVDPATRRVACDDSLAAAGDPCDRPGRIACTADGALELTCAEARWGKKRECRRTPCRLEGDELFCD